MSDGLDWAPPAIADDEPAADALVRLGCLDYADWQPAHAAQARALLAADPTLAAANLATAAVVGDVEAATRLLAADPTLATQRLGPLGWEPLLYACYTRLDSPAPGHSALAVARRLLAHGADPDAGFLWRGLVPPFTALTGAFGEGEGGASQPPHRERDALVRALLDGGADPNDGQTLYNRHFRPADDHLIVLLAAGLGRDRGGPWYRRLGARLASPAQLLAEELWTAARRGWTARADLLLDHGAEPDRPGLRDGRTPHQAALVAGQPDLAAHLLARGATARPLTPLEAFTAACLGGRANDARALLAAQPTLLTAHDRLALVHRAVEADRPDGIRLLHALGFPLDRATAHDGVGANLAATPMHSAAWNGNLALVELLVSLGADPHLRDPQHRATPRDWAAYNHQAHVVAYLSTLPPPAPAPPDRDPP